MHKVGMEEIIPFEKDTLVCYTRNKRKKDFEGKEGDETKKKRSEGEFEGHKSSEERIVEALEMYYGIGVGSNEEEGKKRLEELGKEGSKLSKLLHDHFEIGWGDERLVQVFEGLKEEAKREDGLASWCETIIGEIYQNARGVEKDVSKAVEFYESSAKKGNAAALFSLGNTFLYEGSKDVPRAIECFERGTERSSSACINSLGEIFLKGEHVEKDLKKAIALFERGAEFGDFGSLFALGNIYNEEEECVDFEKAGECFLEIYSRDRENEGAVDELSALVSEKKVEWKPQYHEFWQCELLDQVRTEERAEALLLVSKFRRNSTLSYLNFFRKPIALNVVKFLFHLCQE